MTDNKESAPAPSRPSEGIPVARSHAVWKGGMEFEAGVGSRTHRIDGNSKVAPSPVETLLSSIGTCASTDVVDILTKQRTPPSKLEVDVLATRRSQYPRRVMTLVVTFAIDGDRIDAPQAERAISLSFERYCTVAASLAGDITLESVLVLNGERHEPVSHRMFSASFPS